MIFFILNFAVGMSFDEFHISRLHLNVDSSDNREMILEG